MSLWVNPRLVITHNWDRTANLSLDNEPVLTRKSPEECEEKAAHLDIYLKLKDLEQAEKAVDTPPPAP